MKICENNHVSIVHEEMNECPLCNVVDLITAIISRIESSNKGSIGSVDNTYIAQISIDEIDKWKRDSGIY